MNYVDKNYGFSIKCPIGWDFVPHDDEILEKDKYKRIVTFKSPQEDVSDRYLDNLGIGLWDLSNPVSNIEFANKVINEAKHQNNILDHKLTELPDGHCRLIFSMKPPGTDLVLVVNQVYIGKNNQRLVLEWCTEYNKYSKYSPIFNHMASSFRLVKTTR